MVTSGSRRRRKRIRVWHIHHLAKGWRCGSPSLRWLARPQYGLLLFSRWLTAKTRNYVKVNTTGIMKELQSRCGDAIGRLFKTRTHTRTHTQAHTTVDEKLRPGVLPIRLLFSSLCSSSAGLILWLTDGRTDGKFARNNQDGQANAEAHTSSQVVCFELLGTGGAGENTCVGWLVGWVSSFHRQCCQPPPVRKVATGGRISR